MTVVSIERLVSHLQELAAAFDVVLVEHADAAPEDAFAAITRRVVVVAPVTEETGYAVALHEIGHLVSPLGALGGNHGLNLAAEHAAWEWAQHHALDWSPAMQQVMEWSLSTYNR